MKIPLLVAALLLTGCASGAMAEPEVTSTREPELQALVDAASLEECPERTEGADAAFPSLPPVILPCLGEGPAVDLATVRGRPMVVNVWASWCPPCVAEMPMLAQAARDYPQVRFLGIDLQDRPDKALRMLDEFDVPFASVVDETGIIRSSMSVSGPPVTFFVTADGVVAGRWDGLIPSRELFDGLLDTYLEIR